MAFALAFGLFLDNINRIKWASKVSFMWNVLVCQELTQRFVHNLK